MSNDGLSTANFLGGAMQGYQFMAGVEENKQRAEDRKQMAGLRDADSKQRTEQFAMQKTEHGARMRALNQEQQDRAEASLAKRMFAIDSGKDLSEEEKQEFIKSTGGSRLLDPSYVSTPEFGVALDTVPLIMQGKIDLNDPRAISAVNSIINVQRGATDGRQVSINRIVPSRDGQGLHLGLHVKNADGTENQDGVLTDGRSSDPNDTVSTLSMDELMGVYGAAKDMRDLTTNPRLRQVLYRKHGLVPGTEIISAKDRSQIEENKARTDLLRAQASSERSGTNHRGSGGGDSMTQRQKDFEFAVSGLGMDQESAKEWAFADKTPSERAEDYANRMIAAESSLESKPEGYTPRDSWNAHRAAYINEYTAKKPASSDGKGATKPLQQYQAPDAAIKFLKENPDQADNFKAKYGYLPAI